MPQNETKPGRRGTIIGWSVFLAVLVIFGLFLAKLVPPQPRCSFEFSKNGKQEDVIAQFVSAVGDSLVAFSGSQPEGGTYCGSIQVWNTHTGRCTHKFLDRIDFYWHEFSPSNRFLAIIDTKGSLHLLDFQKSIERKNVLRGLIDADDLCRVDLIFSPGENFLLLRDKRNDGPSHLIETETGNTRETIQGLYYHNFSGKDEIFVFRTKNGTGICNPGTNKSPQIIKHTSPVALAPHGSHLLAFKGGQWEGGHGYVLWKIPLGKPDEWQSLEIQDRQGWEVLDSTIFSPDSKTLAVESLSNHEGVEVTFWDVAGNRQISKSFPVPISYGRRSFSPDSKSLLLIGDKELAMLDPNGIRWQKELEWEVNEFGGTRFLETSESWFLVRWIAQGGLAPTHEYQVVDLATGTTRSTIELSFRDSASLSRNGRYLVVHEEDNQEPGFLARLLENWWTKSPDIKEHVKVMDVLSGKTLAAVPAKGLPDNNVGWIHSNYLLSDDGHTLIVANPQEKSWSVQCWTMPLHPPWTWVVGPPLGILFIAVVGRWLNRSRTQLEREK